MPKCFDYSKSFQKKNNAFAPTIFKNLAHSLVENHEESTTREYLMKNLIKIFETIPSIPVGFIVDPLVKWIQEGDGATYFYNTIDFDFFAAVAKHPKLHPRNALQIIDILAKIYLNDLSYATWSGNAFMEISNKFHEDDAVKGNSVL